MDSQTANHEKRIRQLEKCALLLFKKVESLLEASGIARETVMLGMSNQQFDDARFMALYSFVGELAGHEGISPKEFTRHYETRLNWWEDFYLRRVERISPSLAAEIDKRTIADCGVEATYPPLFDPPPEDKP